MPMARFIVSAVIITAFVNIGCVDARIHKMKFITKCGCASTVSKERDGAYKKLNDALSISENIITINNCLPGYEFKFDNYDSDSDNANANANANAKYKIECIRCAENYYRTAGNSSCIRCPVGFYSGEGDSECIKADSNSSNVHTLCNRGHIIGNDKFAKYEDSCYKCNADKKEYMPYNSNHDKCFSCPAGSIVDEKSRKCTECPVGYYENNNKCAECPIGTYADKKGTDKCKVCNNEFALAYNSVGGYTCENSIFYDITENIKNNIVNMDMLLKPMAYAANIGIAAVSNNRRAVELAIPCMAMAYAAYSM
jgi:hypothetical protein